MAFFSGTNVVDDSNSDTSSLTPDPEPPSYVQSTSVAGPSGTTSQHAIIALHRKNRMHLIQFPQTVYGRDKIGEVFAAAWSAGIKNHGWYSGAYEYCFNGSPWGDAGEQSGIASRRLMCAILQFLYKAGWVLQTAYVSSHWKKAMDSLLFRRADPASLPDVEWMSMNCAYRLAPSPGDDSLDSANHGERWEAAVSGRNRLRIICNGAARTVAEEAAGSPAHADRGKRPATWLDELIESLELALRQNDFFEGTEKANDSVQFKLKGSPWWGVRKGAVTQRVIVLRFLDTLDRFGWRLYGTMRQRMQLKDQHKLDTWYFVRTTDWVPGSPLNADQGTSSHGLS